MKIIQTGNLMKINTNRMTRLMSMVGIVAGLMTFISTAHADGRHEKDDLYIGDTGDDTVKRFDAKTGEYKGEFLTYRSGGINGSRGMIFTKGSLFVANQNVDQIFNGEILRFQRETGEFQAAPVPCNPPLNRSCDPNAPVAPRGLIRGPGNTMYVADYIGNRVAQYNLDTGKFLGNLDITGFSGNFFPRGLVLGPDGLLYVSADEQPANNPLAGHVLRFDPRTGKFKDVFTSNVLGKGKGLCATLHRPEGLAFGPDENLYVTSFRNNDDPNDNDRVLIVDHKSGRCIDQINLAPPRSQAGDLGRAFAQALLFGPRGDLFVPISGPLAGQTGPVTGDHTGEVRRYDVKTKHFKVFVPSYSKGGPLRGPWYLTFGETDPKTLEYDD